jgi:hypothetical protein
MERQREARARYLKWAKRRGYHIHNVILKVDKGDEYLDVSGGQSMLWLSQLAPYFLEGEVHFGYIRGDDFWHTKHEFAEAFQALSRLANLSCLLKLPLEWCNKGEVLCRLSNWEVPNNCWWTCDGEPRGKRPCGRCVKCEELAIARGNVKGVGATKAMRR